MQNAAVSHPQMKLVPANVLVCPCTGASVRSVLSDFYQPAGQDSPESGPSSIPKTVKFEGNLLT